MKPIHRLDLPDAEFADAFQADPAPGDRPSARSGFTRLVSCHVSNFGRLHNQDFSFEPGLNVIEAANGVGKTTLASFIKTMFYGFNDEAVEQGRDDLRERYRPWQGGTYGGSLVFEGSSGTFRVERTFGDTPREDFLAVFDLKTGGQVKGLSGDLGRQVFGLDADSFERSTYVARLSGPHTRPTQRMLAKMSGTTVAPNQAPSPSSLDQVAARHDDLCRRSKEYAEEMHRIEAMFPNGTPSNVPADELTEALTRLSNAGTCREAESEEMAAVRDFVARSAERFTDGLPSEAEIVSYQDVQNKLVATRAQQSATGLDRNDADQLADLRATFFQGVPTPQQIASCQDSIARLGVLEGNLRGVERTEADDQRLAVLENYFKAGVPSEDDIQRCRALVASAATMRTLDTAELAAPEPRRSLVVPVVMAVVGASLLAAGLVVAVVITLVTAGVVIAIAGLTVLIVAAMLAFVGRSSSAKSSEEGASEGEQRAQAMEAQAKAFTSQYAHDVEPEVAIQTISRLRNEHISLKERIERADVASQQIREQMAPLRAGIDEFLGAYFPLPVDPQAALTNLQSMVANYNRLQQKEAQAVADLQSKATYADELESRLVKFLSNYYSDVNADNAANLLSNLAGTVAAYEQALDMLENAKTSEDERALRQRQAQNHLGAVCRRYGWKVEQADERFADSLYAACAKYPVLQAKIDAVRAQLRELVATYGPPPYNVPTAAGSQAIEENFASYIERFSGIAASGVAVDENAGAVIRQQGRVHDLNELSTGYSDVIAFCMRMALGDALFEGAKPFVILDDPFVNLDDRHMGEALSFVKDLADDRQIVYLTCHSSRSM